jgi:hypothetical protein
MVIKLQRFGGVAGIIRPPIMINTEACDAAAAAQLDKLLRVSNFFELPSEILPERPIADSFQYELTIQVNGNEHTVTTTERSAPQTLRDLLQAVRDFATK